MAATVSYIISSLSEIYCWYSSQILLLNWTSTLSLISVLKSLAPKVINQQQCVCEARLVINYNTQLAILLALLLLPRFCSKMLKNWGGGMHSTLSRHFSSLFSHFLFWIFNHKMGNWKPCSSICQYLMSVAKTKKYLHCNLFPPCMCA